MPERVPCLSLLVPGPWTEPEALARALTDRGVVAEVAGSTPIVHGAVQVAVVAHPDLAAALRWGRTGPLPEALSRAIGACTYAALVSIGVRLDRAPARVAEVGRALQACGGVAVRMQASGAAWGWAAWLDALDAGTPYALLRLAVTYARSADDAVFSIGMHHFDLADAEVSFPDGAQAVAWLEAFNLYRLAEAPALTSGHTFQPDADVPRRAFERWPDRHHAARDGRYNPYGQWRFLAPGAPSIDPLARAVVLLPTLFAVLMAAERRADRPLTQAEVEALAEKSPAIAMDHREALALEASRGYADLLPERAWEQWQIARRS